MNASKRHYVALPITCGDRTCAPCACQTPLFDYDDVRRCALFHVSIRRCRDGAFHRCRECLAAERRVERRKP